MGMIYKSLDEVAYLMRPADVFVMGFPNAPLPIHTAALYSTAPPVIVEGWFSGVQTVDLAEVIADRLTVSRHRSRRLWYFPLAPKVTDAQRSAAIAWAGQQLAAGVKYDWRAAFRSVWDKPGEQPGDPSYALDDQERLMCVEVVGNMLEQAGLVPPATNPAELMAGELAALAMRLGAFAPDYFQLWGTPHEIL